MALGVWCSPLDKSWFFSPKENFLFKKKMNTGCDTKLLAEQGGDISP